MDGRYRVGELAAKAGVTKRTIHYYINRGLLPPAEGSGSQSYYTEEHFARLLLIKKLQDKYLPLDKIRQVVTGLSLAQVQERLAQGEEAQSVGLADTQVAYSVETNALGREYVRLELGLGIELNYTKQIGLEKREAIEAIVRYARRVLEEK